MQICPPLCFCKGLLILEITSKPLRCAVYSHSTKPHRLNSLLSNTKAAYWGSTSAQGCRKLKLTISAASPVHNLRESLLGTPLFSTQASQPRHNKPFVPRILWRKRLPRRGVMGAVPTGKPDEPLVVLDRNKFSKVVHVMALKLPKQLCHRYMRLLRRYETGLLQSQPSMSAKIYCRSWFLQCYACSA